MDLQAVEGSKSVAKLGWEDKVLGIVYVQSLGFLYKYSPVPKDVYDVIQTSTSKGHTVDALVKKFVPAKYQCERVKYEPEKAG